MSAQRTPEQIHYESLISLFKDYSSKIVTFLGIVSTIMAILTAYILWTLGSDRNAMNTDRKELQEEYKLTIQELKGDIKDLKNDSKDAIEKIKQNAESELLRVNVETKILADLKTREELDKYFQTERIKKMISDETDKKLKSIVDVSVNENTENFFKISNAAIQMRSGKYEGIELLKSYAKNFPNIRDRDNANQLYYQICEEYQKNVGSNLFKAGDYTESAVKQAIYREKYNFQGTTFNTDDEKYKSITKAEVLEYLIMTINDKKTHLAVVATYIAYISHLSNNNFRAFEIDKINVWYKENSKSMK